MVVAAAAAKAAEWPAVAEQEVFAVAAVAVAATAAGRGRRAAAPAAASVVGELGRGRPLSVLAWHAWYLVAFHPRCVTSNVSLSGGNGGASRTGSGRGSAARGHGT